MIRMIFTGSHVCMHMYTYTKVRPEARSSFRSSVVVNLQHCIIRYVSTYLANNRDLHEKNGNRIFALQNTP